MNRPAASQQPPQPASQPSPSPHQPQQPPPSSQPPQPPNEAGDFDNQPPQPQQQQPLLPQNMQNVVMVHQRNNKIAPVAKPAGVDPLILLQERENRWVWMNEMMCG